MGRLRPANVLALQARAGNAAVTNLFGAAGPSPTVQRQPVGATSDISAEDAEYVATDVQSDFYSLYQGLMRANTLPNTTQYRHGLMLQLDDIGMEAAVDRGVFTDPRSHMNDIGVISEKLHNVQAKLTAQNAHAKRLWTQFDAQCVTAQNELRLGAADEQNAAAILGESYGNSKQRFQSLGSYAVAEDFVHTVDMLKNNTHLALGKTQAAREEQQLTAESEALARDLADTGAEGPGFWGTVWSVVGWDSFGDFVGDLALSAATLGASKWLKGAKRGKKALEAAKLARGARKVKYLKRLAKLDKIKDATERMVVAVAQHQAEISSLTKWARANAASLMRKLATDLISDAATQGVQQVPSTVISRVTKGYVQVVVDEVLNVSEEQAKQYVKLSNIALFAGKEDSHRRLLGAFMSVAVRRRGLTNMIHTTLSRTGRFEVPTDLKAVGVDLASIAITTAREVINDFLNGLPYVDAYKSYLQGPIEAALKTLEKAVQAELPR
jgi:hypothetical protein